MSCKAKWLFSDGSEHEVDDTWGELLDLVTTGHVLAHQRGVTLVGWRFVWTLGE